MGLIQFFIGTRLGRGLGAVLAIAAAVAILRWDAVQDDRQKTEVQVLKQYQKIRKDIDDAQPVDLDADSARERLRARPR